MYIFNYRKLFFKYFGLLININILISVCPGIFPLLIHCISCSISGVLYAYFIISSLKFFFCKNFLPLNSTDKTWRIIIIMKVPTSIWNYLLLYHSTHWKYCLLGICIYAKISDPTSTLLPPDSWFLYPNSHLIKIQKCRLQGSANNPGRNDTFSATHIA